MESQEIYKEKIREFYDRISEFANSKPEIYKFIEEKEKYFVNSFLPQDQTDMVLFDWVIFDYKNEYGQTLLDRFLESTQLSWEDKATYAGFKDNKFGIFRVKAVKIGKAAVLALLPGGKEYQIYDSSATKSIAKGDVIIIRVIAFRDIYVLSGPVLTYPDTTADVLKVMLEGNTVEQDFAFTPRDMIRMFEDRAPKEEKPVDIYAKAKAAGIKKEKVDELLEKTRAARYDTSVNPKELINEFLSHANNFDTDTIEGLASAYYEKWNSIVADKSAKIGPLEETLIAGAMKDAVIKEVRPLEIKDPRERQEKVNAFTKKWIDTPLEALEGRTPREAVIKERKARGDERQGMEYSLSFDSPAPSKAEQKAEKLYYEAIEFMQAENYSEALRVFLQYNKIWKENHVVWYNMAMCYAKLGLEGAGMDSIVKSLEIKPDYEFAAKGLNNFANFGSKEIKSKARRTAEKHGIEIRKIK